MRVLMVGAGAVGGYFGGRLVEKGVDVTFLVRERRRRQLEERGLRIRSVNGDAVLAPGLIQAGETAEPFDVVMISTKAYHFAEAVESVKPYVGPDTTVIPLLNGMAHMELLQQTFGRERVLGGLCFIETTLDEHGDVIQTSPRHELVYGELAGGRSPRVEALERLFAGANAGFRLSEQIVQDMWQKYVFITVLSGMTTLMNAPVGPIREAVYGMELTRQLTEEVTGIMRAEGAPLAEEIVDQTIATFAKQLAPMKSSMLRDMEKGLPIEGDHLQGYLLQLAEKHGVEAPFLRIVYHNLKVYEIKRAAGK